MITNASARPEFCARRMRRSSQPNDCGLPAWALDIKTPCREHRSLEIRRGAHADPDGLSFDTCSGVPTVPKIGKVVLRGSHLPSTITDASHDLGIHCGGKSNS